MQNQIENMEIQFEIKAFEPVNHMPSWLGCEDNLTKVGSGNWDEEVDELATFMDAMEICDQAETKKRKNEEEEEKRRVKEKKEEVRPIRTWARSRIARNRAAHAKNGNGKFTIFAPIFYLMIVLDIIYEIFTDYGRPTNLLVQFVLIMEIVVNIVDYSNWKAYSNISKKYTFDFYKVEMDVSITYNVLAILYSILTALNLMDVMNGVTSEVKKAFEYVKKKRNIYGHKKQQNEEQIKTAQGRAFEMDVIAALKADKYVNKNSYLGKLSHSAKREAKDNMIIKNNIIYSIMFVYAIWLFRPFIGVFCLFSMRLTPYEIKYRLDIAYSEKFRLTNMLVIWVLLGIKFENN
jgi:hypothetical protein